MLQRRQPDVLPEHHEEMDPRDPLVQPHVSHHPDRDSVGPPAGRQRSHRPGPLQGEARAGFPGSEPGREDPGHGVRGVLGSDAEEPEGGFRRRHFRSHQTQGQEGQEDETVRQAR